MRPEDFGGVTDPLAAVANTSTRPGAGAGRAIDPTRPSLERPGPDANHIAEVERETAIAKWEKQIADYSHGLPEWMMTNFQLLTVSRARAELAHLRNEQPKEGDAALNWKLSDETKERLAEIDENIGMARIRARGFVTGSAPSPAPSPKSQDVRGAFQAIKDAALTASGMGVALYPQDILDHANSALTALAQSGDAQPVGKAAAWRWRKPNECWRLASFHPGEMEKGYELEPLYTAPHRPDASGLIEAAELADQHAKICTTTQGFDALSTLAMLLRSRAADRSAK